MSAFFDILNGYFLIKDPLATTMQRARLLLFWSIVRVISNGSLSGEEIARFHKVRSPRFSTMSDLEISVESMGEQPLPRVNIYGSVVSLVFASKRA